LKLKPQNISLFDCGLAGPFKISQEIRQAHFWGILRALRVGALFHKEECMTELQPENQMGKQPPLAARLELQSSKSPSMSPLSLLFLAPLPSPHPPTLTPPQLPEFAQQKLNPLGFSNCNLRGGQTYFHRLFQTCGLHCIPSEHNLHREEMNLAE